MPAMWTGTVIALLAEIASANRNSFQARPKMIRAVAAIAGATSGSAMRQNAPQWSAPSISADSSSSTGRSRNAWRRITTTNGMMKVALTRISARWVSSRPRKRITR